MNQIHFTVGNGYTVAEHYKGRNVITMSEWIGKSSDEFTKAMGRKPDHVEKTELANGNVMHELIWIK